MTLYPCPDCRIVWSIQDDWQVCHQCGKWLVRRTVRLVDSDRTLSFATLASWAVHGESREYERIWEVK